jgi:hypothetical protein
LQEISHFLDHDASELSKHSFEVTFILFLLAQQVLESFFSSHALPFLYDHASVLVLFLLNVDGAVFGLATLGEQTLDVFEVVSDH